ncbi:MAG TPA: recombinase family protein, partial [Croceibacterium sp.]|nr:recombinase family protein [Croceibacterium sp.]
AAERHTADGLARGRCPALRQDAFSRGALYHLLRNETCLGMIRHKGTLHLAEHPPIVDKALFNKVQRTLDAHRRRHAERRTPDARAPLAGRIFDAVGESMSPTTSRGKLGRYYRYYVSASLQKGGRAQSPASGHEDRVIRRIPADALEGQLNALIARVLPKHANNALELPTRIEVHAHCIHLTLPRLACAGIQGRLTADERIEDDLTDPSSLRLIAAVRVRNRRGRTEIRSSSVRTTRRDPVLINALQRAHAMVELDTRHLPVCRKSPETQYGRRLIGLAFLAPDLQQAILDGTQPADLTLDHLIAKPLPTDWKAQRQLFHHVNGRGRTSARAR